MTNQPKSDLEVWFDLFEAEKRLRSHGFVFRDMGNSGYEWARPVSDGFWIIRADEAGPIISPDQEVGIAFTPELSMEPADETCWATHKLSDAIQDLEHTSPFTIVDAADCVRRLEAAGFNIYEDHTWICEPAPEHGSEAEVLFKALYQSEFGGWEVGQYQEAQIERFLED